MGIMTHKSSQKIGHTSDTPTTNVLYRVAEKSQDTRFPDGPRNHRKIIFSDECAIYKSSKSRNIYFWAKENPFYKEEVENNPPHTCIVSWDFSATLYLVEK